MPAHPSSLIPHPFLAHFDTLAETPDAVAKLRQLVFRLALSGKLVLSCKDDEPATDLLNRIRHGRNTSKRGDKPAPSFPLQNPRELPTLADGWSWATLSEVSIFNLGRTPSTKDSRFWDTTGIPWVSIGDMEQFGTVTKTERGISQLGVEECFQDKPVPAGTVLMSFKLTIGKVSVLGMDAYHNEAIISIYPEDGILKEFLFRFLPTLALQGITKNALMGSTLNRETLRILPIPIPPTREQRRIVAKVEELLALCDALEAAQTAAREHRTRLVRSALDHLTTANGARLSPAAAASPRSKALEYSQAPPPPPRAAGEDTRAPQDDFRQHASFVLQHSDLVLDSVSDLRKVILSLAVQGRVVSQNPKDEPASKLLKQIGDERERLVAEKKLGASPRMKIKELPKKTLPKGWVWAAFGAVTFCRDGERIPVNSDERENLAKTYDYYGASGVIDKIDRYLFDKPLLLIGEDGANLINRSTPIAFIAEGKYWVNNHAHVLDTINRTLMEYLRIYINSINLESYITGMAQPKMNQAQMNSIPIALPPLAEQQRIVAKVDELMRWCDALEARLTTAQTTAATFLDATLHQILAA